MKASCSVKKLAATGQYARRHNPKTRNFSGISVRMFDRKLGRCRSSYLPLISSRDMATVDRVRHFQVPLRQRHVSGVLTPIIRSSTAIVASGFTFGAW